MCILNEQAERAATKTQGRIYRRFVGLQTLKPVSMCADCVMKLGIVLVAASPLTPLGLVQGMLGRRGAQALCISASRRTRMSTHLHNITATISLTCMVINCLAATVLALHAQVPSCSLPLCCTGADKLTDRLPLHHAGEAKCLLLLRFGAPASLYTPGIWRSEQTVRGLTKSCAYSCTREG